MIASDEIRLLLCDDQEIVAAALKHMLADCPKLTVEHVAKGSELLKVIRSFEPTVLLQDLVLEDASGLELVRQVRAEKDLARLPIVVLSTTEDAKVKFKAFASGANDYVVKFPEAFELIGRISYHSRAYNDGRLRDHAQSVLAQRSRLESLGTLSAGLAHEMNTPLQYLTANLEYLKSSLSELAPPDQRTDFLDAIRDCIDGTGRIAEIVRAMKAFSHSRTDSRSPTNLRELLADVISLSKSEWRSSIAITLDVPGSCSPVQCIPSAIAQALLNILLNSAQAIEGRTEQGKIRIRLTQGETFTSIEVTDNGGGIDASIRHRIYDPFFTTREVGKGSGQGLTVARSIIEETHGGQLTFWCEDGCGTTFRIDLPNAAVETLAA